MARDHARIRLDIWADDDFRDLSSSAQWLYLHLTTSPTLTFVGITDWRPARIAAVTAELTADDVEMFAAELERDEYVVIDRDSEEVLIRSWIRHDGLMRSPNMAKALAKDHAATASRVLRAVIVDQLLRLQEKEPNHKGWAEIGKVLAKRSMTPAEGIAALPPNPSANPSPNPSGKGSANPSGDPSGNGSGNPSATPFLPSSLPHRLPRKSKAVPASPHQGTPDLGLETA